MVTTAERPYEVHYEHFKAALDGSVKGNGFTDVLSDWVAETLFYASDERPVQDCLAGLLREQGWVCTPPAVDATKGGA